MQRGQGIPIGVRPQLLEPDEWKEFWHSLPPEIQQNHADYKDYGIAYFIHDGFHRSEVMRQLGYKFIDCMVWYNMTVDEFYDEKVKRSLEHDSVKLSRLSLFINNAFALTPWHESGIRIDQIFSLASTNTNGIQYQKRFDITPSDIEAMKKWAHDKAKEWDTTVGTMHQDLLIVVNIDPKLIRKIHTSGGGSRGKGVLSISRLRTMASVLDKDTDPDYRLQNILVNVIIKHNILTTELKEIAEVFLEFQDNPEILDMLIQDPRNVSLELLKQQQEEADQQLIESLTEEDEDNGFPEQNRSNSVYSQKPSDTAYNKSITPEDLQRENQMLREQIQILSQHSAGEQLMLLTAENLSSDEELIIHDLFSRRLTFRQIAQQYNTTENHIWSLLSSAITKYNYTNELRHLKNNIKKVRK